MRDNRRKEIAAYISRQQFASMNELCEVFHASINTIRADIAFLEKTGTVEKVYGGVRSVLQQEIPLFTQRTQLHAEAKLAIVRAAADFLQDGDTLFVDAGTTTMNLLSYLPPERRLTVVTGNLHLIAQAGTRPNVELVVLPGCVNRRTNSVSDVSTLEFLGRHHFIKALMATTGLSADGKLNVSSYLEYEIKQLAVRLSEQRILLCDSVKFGATGLLSYAALSDMDMLITDRSCPDALRELCEQSNTRLHITE
ncbi:MAG: DeoR/GlpR transcriptional regulator [Oscillospiraceae bacterium]|nr:DeoR/GlpR transcriptional regulator [Oscillospiraceae bacterium]